MVTRWKLNVSCLALLLVLAGCGDGGMTGSSPAASTDTMPGSGVDGSSPELGPANENEPRRRTGVFVDSAVSGLGYATETRSGVTDGQGRFEYLAGESITFSIGALEFPAVVAVDRMTPVDLARDATDVLQSAINIARLLQSLDADANADNGIEIPAEAVATAAAVNFDVEPAVFEIDPDVMGMVASSQPDRGLIPEAAAIEHFSVVLGSASSYGATAGVAGFWRLEENEFDVDALRAYYAVISRDGELSQYRYRAQDQDSYFGFCFEVEHHTLTSLGGDDFLVADAPGGGTLGRMTLERTLDARLRIDHVESLGEHAVRSTLEMVPSGDLMPADLPLCLGESSQVPPVEQGLSADIAGLWMVDDEQRAASEDRRIRYVQIDGHGDIRLLAPQSTFGPAPEFEISECQAPIGDLTIWEGDDEGTFQGDGIFQETVIERVGDATHEFPSFVSLTVSFTKDGDALLFNVQDEAERRLMPAGIDVTALAFCGDEELTPVQAVEGLWRERDANLFAPYVHINESGVMGGVDPAPGNDTCYLDVPDATLTPLGGLDFLAVRHDDGVSRELRMTLDGDVLVIGEIAADGSVSPVRWLEKAHGFSIEDFERCEDVPVEAAIEDLVPLAGRWSRVESEEVTNWGPNGTESIYRRYNVVDISANGQYKTTSLSVGEYYSFSRETLCVDYRPGTYQDFSVVGDGLFRLNGQLITMAREGNALNVTYPHGSALPFERSDIDIDALPNCSDGLTLSDPLLGPLDGLWLLDSPTGDDPSFTMVRFDTRLQESSNHFLYRYDDGCHAAEPMSLEVASEERIVLGRPDTLESIVGLFEVVDGELDITLRSGHAVLPGVRDGRFPKVRGFDADQLLAQHVIHGPTDCTAGEAR